jgi:hypothetical protein
MAWRMQLATRPIRRLDILAGKPQVLAAWTQANEVHYFELFHGAKIDHRNFDEPTDSDHKGQAWQHFFKSLVAPNNVLLPFVKARQTAIYTSQSGQMRLFQQPDHTFQLEVGDKSSPLTLDASIRIVASGMDRTLGFIALLDSTTHLHLYQQHIRVGIFETALSLSNEMTPTLSLPHGGGFAIAGDGRHIVVVEPTGKIRSRFETHYPFGTFACSPNGTLIAVTDLDSDVIRVYETNGFVLRHQRFAVDLLADSRRIQLLPMTASAGAVGAVAISDKGTLAFTTAGMICVTNMVRMKAVGVVPDDEQPADFPTITSTQPASP